MLFRSHNSIYPALLSSLYAISERKFFMITEIYPTRVDSAQKEHKALIEAIRDQDRKSIIELGGHYSQSVVGGAKGDTHLQR